jgi:hypothetical protein
LRLVDIIIPAIFLAGFVIIGAIFSQVLLRMQQLISVLVQLLWSITRGAQGAPADNGFLFLWAFYTFYGVL